MSAKFIHTFADENPELQKQIGCMTGIFQIFDRHHFLSARRLNAHKRLPSGNANLNSSVRVENNAYSPSIVLEKNPSKNMYENRRVSMESSQTSFSTSSCSSFSSLEGNKSTQRDLPTNFNRTIFPDGSFKTSPNLKTAENDTRPVNNKPHSKPSNTTTQPIRQSIDFREVVKDSIYRDTPILSVKTSTKGVKTDGMKYRDSPRPIQLSKSMDGSYMIGMNGKSMVELDESIGALVKLKETQRHFRESGEPPRSSYEAKEATFTQVHREAPRFSYDRRRASLDSREQSNAASNLRDLPRLSLDSREGSLRSSNFDPKQNSILNDLKRVSIREASSASNPKQELSDHKSSPGVVAKLMGLDVLPNMSVATLEPMDSAKTYIKKDYSPKTTEKNQNSISKSVDPAQESKQDRLSHSPRNSLKDPPKPRINKSDSIMKPISHSKAIETAPWKQADRTSSHQRAAAGYREAGFKQPLESIYSEIEKRLKDLEFRQSSKDLRALKQILDAMQAKGLLQTKNGEKQQSGVSVRKNNTNQPLNGDDENLISASVGNRLIARGSNSPKAFESPIVIMKPAKSVRSGTSASSVVPLEGLQGLRKLRTSTSDKNKSLTYSRVAKDQTPKSSSRDPSNQPLLTADKTSIQKSEECNLQRARSRTGHCSPRSQQPQRESNGSARTGHCSPRSQQPPREGNGSALKSTTSLSPRLQQRKLESDRRLRPPLPSSESNKPPRLPSNKQQSESVSPRGKIRQRPTKVEERDDQLRETSETRNLNRQGDEVSLKSDSNVSLASQVDEEVTSADRSADANAQQSSPRLSGRASSRASSIFKKKKSLLNLDEEVPSTRLAANAPEQPSPISVLDAPFQREELSASPVKNTSDEFEDGETRASDDKWNLLTQPNSPQPIFTSEINKKKLQSIQNLVQKLSELSSSDDRATETDHIASLCETQKPDHRYVSEILLASGLLLRDLSDGPMGPMPIQLHPSGHPINPDMFFVIEQTKSGWLSKPESIHEGTTRPKHDLEKLNRKLLFDVVNEILIQKLELTSQGTSNLLLRARKFPRRFPSGQRLLREVCTKIEQLQAESPRSDTTDEDSSMAGEEVLRTLEGWDDFEKEVPGVVLEIERMIFKDLIDELVLKEATYGWQPKSSRRRRQLFAK